MEPRALEPRDRDSARLRMSTGSLGPEQPSLGGTSAIGGSYASGYARRCHAGDAKSNDRRRLLSDRNAYIAFLEAQVPEVEQRAIRHCSAYSPASARTRYPLASRCGPLASHDPRPLCQVERASSAALEAEAVGAGLREVRLRVDKLEELALGSARAVDLLEEDPETAKRSHQDRSLARLRFSSWGPVDPALT